jgi:hypothetical protein
MVPYAASAQPGDQLEDPSRLIGSWEGQWNGQWKVRFTISAADNGYLVRYEWQEFQGGPFQADTFRAYPASKSSIRASSGLIEIIAERSDAFGATAIGNFLPRRTARLKRIP